MAQVPSTVMSEDVRDRLSAWFGRQLTGARDVRIEGLDRIEFGHSAEMMVMTLARMTAGSGQRRDVVLRLRPPAPGLLEPYDLPRQFAILRALEGTSVRAPRALWLEETGDVLGRPFYVMERLDGEVYEREVPPELEAAPERIRRMSESMAEQIAAIHLVDLRATGLDALGDGRNYLDRELDHWAGEMHRVQRGPLPALERLLQELRERQPEQTPTPTLVHGDPKPGNFAFVGEEVNAVFDWEMAGIGDPLADIGWAELMWMSPVSSTSRPSSLTSEEFLARYESLTGITVRHREWYRAFQAYKMVVILLVGVMLFDDGVSDDLRLAQMSFGIAPLTQLALQEFGIKEDLPSGPVSARKERGAQVRERDTGAWHGSER